MAIVFLTVDDWLDYLSESEDDQDDQDDIESQRKVEMSGIETLRNQDTPEADLILSGDFIDYEVLWL